MYFFWIWLTILLWPCFILLTLWLFNKSRLRITKNSLSDLGSNKKCGSRFDILLIISGVIQLIIFAHFGNYNLGTYFLIGTTIFGILSGLIRQATSRKIHDFISAIGFLISSPGWILFGLTYKSLIVIVWGAVIIPIIIIRTRLDKHIAANSELLLFVGAWITNLVLIGLIV